MKFFSGLFVGLLLTAGSGAAIAAAMGTAVVLTPDSLKWVPGTGPAKGSTAATLLGDPNKSGNAIIRVDMPDGYTNQPHYHSHPEFITVLKGTLLFGIGDTIDKAKAKTLPTGSFVMVPTGVHHWSMAQGDTIEQVSGEGPLTNIPVKHNAM
jgi:quercetin dioxygenase-like cupin family protein